MRPAPVPSSPLATGLRLMSHGRYCCPWRWPRSFHGTGQALEVKQVKVSPAVETCTSTSSSSTAPPSERVSDVDLQSEDSSRRIGDQLFAPRPLTQEEREQAWTSANFYDATSGQDQPVALWILGPSSVGKSTISVEAGPRFDIPRLRRTSPQTPGDERRQLDAVLIDGEFMRDAHGVWQQWVKTPDWRSAYPALKSTINREKDAMCAKAVRERKHLIIPQTALNLQKALVEMGSMAQSGYTNHVLAVVAPFVECQKRGLKRELATGKRYQPSEFQKSISAIAPLVAACNGRYAIVRVAERHGVEHGMDFRTLCEGVGDELGQAKLGSPGVSPDIESLRATIDKAVQ
eukprot:gb/GFBE01077676.1/.p1 GENE.gb/GFBE01077676.1/~~gb/GFBE01077676.1/.p1  ORF type:complete len:347 (+),score=47.58 gb/GFBE01077676.1/:1-1041(+)